MTLFVLFTVCTRSFSLAPSQVAFANFITSIFSLKNRRKFSVKGFSADILKYNCQAVQYIGELARYLVNAPPNADDEKLNIKYALGNGLNKEIWAKFQVSISVF